MRYLVQNGYFDQEDTDLLRGRRLSRSDHLPESQPIPKTFTDHRPQWGRIQNVEGPRMPREGRYMTSVAAGNRIPNAAFRLQRLRAHDGQAKQGTLNI